jgi:hypothetical protein
MCNRKAWAALFQILQHNMMKFHHLNVPHSKDKNSHACRIMPERRFQKLSFKVEPLLSVKLRSYTFLVSVYSQLASGICKWL